MTNSSKRAKCQPPPPPVFERSPTDWPKAAARAGAVTVWIVLTVALTAACAPANTSATTTARPRTPAQLQILAPTPNQVVVGSTIDLKLAITGATVVAPSQVTGISPTEGHIHVSVDGKLVSMTYGLSQQLAGLSPGTHTVQAEFVASDHRPFANRVVAAVVFQVQ